MTNRNEMIQRLSLGTLVAAASLPVFVACATGSNSASGAASPSASAGAPPPQGQAPPPGYAQQPQPPPAGYPQQQPPPAGYPQQQPPPAGYPQQPVAGQPAPQQPVVPPGATVATPVATASAAPTPAPLGSVVTTDPNQLAALFAQAAAAGQALLQQPGKVPGDPTELGLAAQAAIHAKGETLQGQIAKANLQEGGHNEFMVTMQPGTCYTIIGFSPPGQVKNVDLHLLAPPFYNMLAGQDTTDNNTAFIGSTPNPMCPIIPLPLQYKVDITARTGSGTVGVGVYTKSK
ncbi:MAG: hypothetical protein ACLQVI_39260 [Polyangiaceae bacterium]